MKFFSWKALRRVIEATVADPVETLVGLRGFLGILLFICASTRRQIRAVGGDLVLDRSQMAGAYSLIRESMAMLAEASAIFPQDWLREMLELLQQIMPSELATTVLIEKEVPIGQN